jgi:hypothetical protein
MSCTPKPSPKRNVELALGEDVDEQSGQAVRNGGPIGVVFPVEERIHRADVERHIDEKNAEDGEAAEDVHGGDALLAGYRGERDLLGFGLRGRLGVRNWVRDQFRLWHFFFGHTPKCSGGATVRDRT